MTIETNHTLGEEVYLPTSHGPEKQYISGIVIVKGGEGYLLDGKGERRFIEGEFFVSLDEAEKISIQLARRRITEEIKELEAEIDQRKGELLRYEK